MDQTQDDSVVTAKIEKGIFVAVALLAIVWVLSTVLFGVIGFAMPAIILTPIVLLTLVVMTKS